MRIALLELDGSLFFGTADGLRARLEGLEASVDTVILDLHQIKEIDVTAARILFEVADHWGLGGKHLVFSEWSSGDPRRHLIERAGTLSVGRRLNFTDTTDLALEQAEDRLLARLAPVGECGQMLTLADTMLGRGPRPRRAGAAGCRDAGSCSSRATSSCSGRAIRATVSTSACRATSACASPAASAAWRRSRPAW